ADRERMVHSTRIPRGAGLYGPRSELPRRDRLRPGVEAPQRPRPRRGGHGRHHRRRSVAREERLLRPGPTRGDRHVLRRIRGRPHPGESSRPLGGWGQCRRLLQLDDRDVERARLSAAVRPPEDGASGHGRGPVPQVFADLFLGQHPGPRPVHRRRARSPVPRHGGAGDGRGDAEDGENRRLPRVPGRRPFAPQDVESDPAPRARDRVAHAVPAGRVTPHREARIAFRSQSMVSRSAWVPIVPMRIVLGVGCQSPHSRSYRSQVKRFRYHPSTDVGSTDSHRAGATATGAMPAGAAIHFWDAVKPASMPSLPKGSGRPPRDETASTTTNASAAWAASTIGSRAFVTPVEVSLWTKTTAFVGVLSAARSLARSGAAPHGEATTPAFTR